jgi:hypothetical protein
MIGYATESELSSYAEARGVTLTKDESVLLTLALDYLATLDNRWKGEKTDPAQPLAWPRRNVIIRGVSVPDDAVPDAIKTAQLQLAVYADKVNLLPMIGVNSTGAVASKSVGDVSISYSQGTQNKAPLFPDVMRLLADYLAMGGGSNFNVSRF